MDRAQLGVKLHTISSLRDWYPEKKSDTRGCDLYLFAD